MGFKISPKRSPWDDHDVFYHSNRRGSPHGNFCINEKNDHEVLITNSRNRTTWNEKFLNSDSYLFAFSKDTLRDCTSVQCNWKSHVNVFLRLIRSTNLMVYY
jgi:hypothetical protein